MQTVNSVLFSDHVSVSSCDMSHEEKLNRLRDLEVMGEAHFTEGNQKTSLDIIILQQIIIEGENFEYKRLFQAV